LADEEDKVIAYERGKLLFVYNFHPVESLTDYKIGTKWASDHFIVLESDSQKYGGHKRLDEANKIWFEAFNQPCQKRRYHLKLYIPARSCLVLCAYENANDKQVPRMPPLTDRQRHQVPMGMGNHPAIQEEKKS